MSSVDCVTDGRERSTQFFTYGTKAPLGFGGFVFERYQDTPPSDIPESETSVTFDETVETEPGRGIEPLT